MADKPDTDAMRRLCAALAGQPWSHDFYATLRRVDALHPGLPRLGTALRPGAEALRLGQDLELDMAPAALSSFTQREGRPPRLGVRFFGLFGPMGPLPLHLTGYVRERERHHKDAAAARFADVFHHRLLLLFYRAWAQAQPALHLDRPGDDYSRWLGSLIGRSGAAFDTRDALPDRARLANAATLAGGPRHAEGLCKLLRQHFDVPVQVQSHLGRWIVLRRADRTRLQSGSVPQRLNALGAGALAGSKVWDRQSTFRILLGPMSLVDYERFLPGQRSVRELRDWVRQYVGLALQWDLRLCLHGRAVPRLALPRRERPGAKLLPLPGQQGRLGWTTWLGPRVAVRDRRDLRLHPESERRRHGTAAAQMTLVAGQPAA